MVAYAQMSMMKLLWLDSRACVCLIGAGGKTTTMLALAHDILDAGKSVLFTTTTKIRPVTGVPLVCVGASEDVVSSLSEAARTSDMVALCDRVLPQGKLQGVDPSLVCDIVHSSMFDVVLVEADGAAGRALKIHGDGEPVVPACASHLLVVVGLDAIGALPSSDVVHRAELYSGVVGAPAGEIIRAEQVATSLHAAARHAPPACQVAYILNKADDGDRLDAAATVASYLSGGSEFVIASRRGHTVWHAGEDATTGVLHLER